MKLCLKCYLFFFSGHGVEREVQMFEMESKSRQTVVFKTFGESVLSEWTDMIVGDRWKPFNIWDSHTSNLNLAS